MTRDAARLPYGWKPGSARSQVYWTIAMNGLGLYRSELVLALRGLDYRAITDALRWLKVRGSVTQPGGWGTVYLATPGQVERRAAGLVRLGRMLERALAEFPAGISVELLAADHQVSVAEVEAALREAIELRRVFNISMPAEHGGGMGVRPWDPAVDVRALADSAASDEQTVQRLAGEIAPTVLALSDQLGMELRASGNVALVVHPDSPLLSVMLDALPANERQASVRALSRMLGGY